ncbi:MAG: helix-turn-helix domain-containing protein, partial [Nanoarchaeota archaeon]|nr:helix-turn-helix domain-containing protein [Nanoarchaeota archaeon]MBU1321643.1 helix-turn-helix domain-containing protein [Nanoarchaeota archaeon]MBU1597145.1 helix-turn-helix domain-containing protein [Nanoarchaeota archaeon]
MGDLQKLRQVLISTKEFLPVKDISQKAGLSEYSVRKNLKILEEIGASLQKEKKDRFLTYNIPFGLEDRILASNYDYQQASEEKPLEIKTNGDDFSVAFANTLYAGAKTDKTLFQNFLRYNKGQEVDAVIITGNTFYIDSMNFSKYAVDRARITEQPGKKKKRNKYDDGLFLDLEERLELNKTLLADLFKDKKGAPFYEGPVYLIFGEIEENLVRQHTKQLVKYITFKRRGELQNALSDLKTKRKEYKDDKRKLTRVENEISQVQKELSMTIMSNLDKNKVKQIEARVLGYLVNYLQTTIPNSTVISAGEGNFVAGNKTIKAKYSSKKSTNKPSDNLMSSLLGAERKVLSRGDKIADIIVQGGLSTTYTQDILPYMNKAGEKEATLIQLPTCLDRLDLEKKLKKVVLAKDPLTNLAGKPDFITGAVILENIDNLEKISLLQGGFLTNPKIDFSAYKPVQFYEMNVSDEHFGSCAMALTETKDGIEPTSAIAYQFMQKNNIPVVRINNLGDALQEKNYATEVEEHPEHMSPSELEKVLQGDITKDEMRKIIIRNEYRAGIVVPEKQLEEYLKSIPVDFIQQVIENADKAGLVGPRYLMVPGNHTKHTFEGLINPERMITRFLRLMLGIKDEEKIISPMLGKIGHYEGIFGIADAYLYGETNIHKHGGSKYQDPARVVRRTYGQMGRPSGSFEDRFVVCRSGHSHFGGETSSTETHLIQCFCFQESNEFGTERQYPSPPTKGFKINSLPVKGLKYGPIGSINVPVTYLNKWAQEKPLINRNKIFRDSVV